MNNITAVPPLVSVVIPTYKRPDFLIRAAHSAIAQTFTDLEIIAIDDCSPVDYNDALMRLSDKRFRYIRLDSNRGAAAARNIGLENARGRFVAFLDDDDWWYPQKLEQQFRWVRSRHLENASFVVFSKAKRQKFSWLAEVAPKWPIAPGEDVTEYRFRQRGLIHLSTVLMPLSLARKTLFDATLPRNEDMLFFAGCQKEGGEFALCPEVHAALDFTHVQGRLRQGGNIDLIQQVAEKLITCTTPSGISGYYATFLSPKLAAQGQLIEGLALIIKAYRTGSLGHSNSLVSAINTTLSWLYR